ncbi:MAG TPA: PilZ domain-containing protein [Solirubrobacteraceae bacterium]|nr:PilZ domain-containing protein [Solirubrobacteraceae bacterium]
MKFGRSKNDASKPVALPERFDTVTLAVPSGERIPARVLERGIDTLAVAIVVPMKSLSTRELKGMVLEFEGARGRARLRGAFEIPDHSEPDVLNVTGPYSVEVLQEREFVRIKSARPVLVYAGGDRMQIRSYTVDLSGGGFLLAGPDTLKVGEEVKFQLTLTPGDSAISGSGRVVRTDARGRRAVEFERISDFDRRRLVRFIFESQRAERRRGLMEDSYGS